MFQRTYSWRKDNIKSFWEDLIETAKSKEGIYHFFGSFVTMPTNTSPSRAAQYLIIDGQQRFITIFLFLSALRNRILEINSNYEKRDEIYELYLINKYLNEDKYKLIPTQADRDFFFNIIDNSLPNFNNEHPIVAVAKFFKNELSKYNEIDNLNTLKNTLLSRFSVVDIILENNDDPYLIFESLNAKGTPLTQADLIRNYLFMKIDQDNQKNIYDKIWYPMQENLGENIEEFFRHYMAMDGNMPNFNKIYATFKENIDKKAKKGEDIINIIQNLSTFAEYYSTFINPKKESNDVIKEYLNKIKDLEMTTSYPLLLRLYDDYKNGRLSGDDLAKCLKSIETFIVRRALCKYPTNSLNKYFPAIYNPLDESNLVQSLIEKLKSGTGSLEMPPDNKFKQCIMGQPLLHTKIIRYILKEIEKYDNKEPPDFENLQIEHIMPQTLDDDWKNELGNNWQSTHNTYLNTLGNLTLTGYNQEYSNKSFIEKRDMKNGFKDSRLKINKDLVLINKWTEKEIEDRARKLSDIALKIWSI